MKNKNKLALIDFYETIVLPTVKEFYENELDIRRAKLAVIVVYHLCDYMYQFSGKGYKQIKNECEEMTYIRDASNVTKHRNLKKPQTISSSDQLVVTLGLLEAPFGYGYVAEACSIYLDLDKPTKHGKTAYGIIELLEKTMEYWEKEINFTKNN